MKKVLFALLIFLASCHSPKHLKVGDQFRLADWSYSVQNFTVTRVTEKGVFCSNDYVKDEFFSFFDLERSNHYTLISK